MCLVSKLQNAIRSVSIPNWSKAQSGLGKQNTLTAQHEDLACIFDATCPFHSAWRERCCKDREGAFPCPSCGRGFALIGGVSEVESKKLDKPMALML